MSRPVDVLAVMDREIEEARKRVPFMPPGGPQNAEHQREYEEAGDVLVQLREARAAVAALIYAATPAAANDDYGMDPYEIQRLINAIARVRGVA